MLVSKIARNACHGCGAERPPYQPGVRSAPRLTLPAKLGKHLGGRILAVISRDQIKAWLLRRRFLSRFFVFWEGCPRASDTAMSTTRASSAVQWTSNTTGPILTRSLTTEIAHGDIPVLDDDGAVVAANQLAARPQVTVFRPADQERLSRYSNFFSSMLAGDHRQLEILHTRGTPQRRAVANPGQGSMLAKGLTRIPELLHCRHEWRAPAIHLA